MAIIKQEVPIQLDRDLIIKEGINWYRPRIKSKGKVMFIAPTQKEKWKTTNTFFDINEWVHVVATLDGTTMKIYVNGDFIGSYSGHSPIGKTRNYHFH